MQYVDLILILITDNLTDTDILIRLTHVLQSAAASAVKA